MWHVCSRRGRTHLEDKILMANLMHSVVKLPLPVLCQVLVACFLTFKDDGLHA